MRILPSKRSHLYVLERTRVCVRDGRVEYLSEEQGEFRGFNIPVANTIFILLGPGSSISQDAVRILRSEGVCIGFCGSGGTPLLSAQDAPDFFAPADEYRNPSFLQRWIALWANEEKRLSAARFMMEKRLALISEKWPALGLPGPLPLVPDRALARASQGMGKASGIEEMLGVEGRLTIELYRAAATSAGIRDFTRVHADKTLDPTDPNRLLDHGNYLAYGLASVVLWVLGIPASLPIMHGKTRRGGLVFDLADVVKDALVLPSAFNISARMATNDLPRSETTFRSRMIDLFDRHSAIGILFDTMMEILDREVP